MCKIPDFYKEIPDADLHAPITRVADGRLVPLLSRRPNLAPSPHQLSLVFEDDEGYLQEATLSWSRPEQQGGLLVVRRITSEGLAGSERSRFIMPKGWRYDVWVSNDLGPHWRSRPGLHAFRTDNAYRRMELLWSALDKCLRQPRAVPGRSPSRL
jgi:hypothetical protein